MGRSQSTKTMDAVDGVELLMKAQRFATERHQSVLTALMAV
jgi:hypothetical protein